MVDGIKTSGFNKSKLRKLWEQWRLAKKNFESANGKAMATLKDAKESIRESIDQMGIKKSVWNAAMQEIELREKADKVRGRFNEQAMADQFDSVLTTLGVKLSDTAEGPEDEETGDGADTSDAGDDADEVEERRSATVTEIAERAGAKPH